MSDAQVLYLQGRIEKKLHRPIRCLREAIAHHQLYIQLLPFANESHTHLCWSKSAKNQAIGEARDRLDVGAAQWMRTFENNMATRCITKRLAALTLNNSNPVTLKSVARGCLFATNFQEPDRKKYHACHRQPFWTWPQGTMHILKYKSTIILGTLRRCRIPERFCSIKV